MNIRYKVVNQIGNYMSFRTEEEAKEILSYFKQDGNVWEIKSYVAEDWEL